MDNEICKDTIVIQEMFEAIAKRYDLLNALMSCGLHHYWSKYAITLTGLQRGDVALDVCCGTGSLTGLLMQKTQPNGRIIGLDLTPGMLKIARFRLDNIRSESSFRLIQGNANALPFPDNTFDCVVIGYGLRNVRDPMAVLGELQRVVKPTKKIVVLEMAEPHFPVLKELYHLYLAKVIPRLGKWFAHNESAYQYLHQSILQFVREHNLIQLFNDTGLVNIKAYPLTGGIVAIHVGAKAAPGWENSR